LNESQTNNSLWTWGEFSDNQVDVLLWWKEGHRAYDCEIIIADGSIRSGKTLSMSFSFVMWAMTTFDNVLFGLSGKTIGSFRKNVLRDLKKALQSRGAKVKDRRNENIIDVSYNGRRNEFEIFGGKDEGSYALIQGRTLAGFFFDEATLQPRSFIEQAIGRCSIKGSRIWMNCNPDSPFHYIKTDYIEQPESKKVFHLHFELEENTNLDQDIINRLKNLYKGLFYRRYILGEWVVAEGIIYDMFDWNIHSFQNGGQEYARYLVGVDYGTSNPCTFGLYGYNENLGRDTDVRLIKEYYYDSAKENRQKTDGEYAKDFFRFIESYRSKLERIFIDPSALSFIAELKKPQNGVYHLVTAAKNDVIDGIRFVSEKIATNTYTIDKSCENTKKEYETYSWDPNAQKRGEDKPLKQNDHCPDRDRYVLFSRFGGKVFKARTQSSISR